MTGHNPRNPWGATAAEQRVRLVPTLKAYRLLAQPGLDQLAASIAEQRAAIARRDRTRIVRGGRP